MSIARFTAKYKRLFRIAEHLRVGVLATPCWIWQGKLKDGYGRIRVHGVIMRAHRYAFELYRGAIPKDRPDLDHLCRQRDCVNPDHLEPVTNEINTMRGESFAAVNARKKACPAGHPYSLLNTYVDGRGKRYCKTCARERRASKRSAA